MEIAKEPIRLRQRVTDTGKTSLYLDIYLNGRRSYEYLKLYLLPGTDRATKEKNRETLRLAEDIKAKRLVELRNGQFGFENEFKEDTLFFPYYEAMCDRRKENSQSRSNWSNWYCCLKHLKNYEPNRQITFAEITPAWVQGFRDFLDKQAHAWECSEINRDKQQNLSENSKQGYFNKLRCCINQAFEERIIRSNPLRGIQGFKGQESTRVYLTIDELQKMVNTPCNYPSVKNAFLFSCLTGLRRSDIEKLTWSEVHKEAEFTRIIFKQKKTGGLQYLDISPQAAELLGERGKDDARVFPYFLSPDATNNELRLWAASAGIMKHLTFHSGRHTFATMMLTLGTDIYTVSKLLGHSSIGTTQIYAKVVDQKKQEAVAKIPIQLEK